MRLDINGTIVADEDKWIYDWYEIPSVCPKDVKNVLKNANGGEINVYINSGGGDVFAGSEIYSELRGYSGTVKIHITGIAASAASVIACAGQSDISPTATVMIHNVSSGQYGDYHAMDKMSDTLKTLNSSVAAAYCTKTGMREAEALEMMNRETWLTAQRAVELKLIDGITQANNQQFVAAISSVLPQEVIQKTKNMIKKPDDDSDFLMRTKLNLLKMKGGM